MIGVNYCLHLTSHCNGVGIFGVRYRFAGGIRLHWCAEPRIIHRRQSCFIIHVYFVDKQRVVTSLIMNVTALPHSLHCDESAVVALLLIFLVFFEVYVYFLLLVNHLR